MAEILPFTSYFTPQSLAEAKMQGEQLRQMRSQGRMQDAEMRAMMDVYGTPEEAKRQEIMGQQAAMKSKRMMAAGQLLDSLSGVVAQSGYDPEVIRQIKGNPDIKSAVSALVDMDSYEWSPEGENFVFGGEEPLPAMVDGEQGQLKPGEAYTKFPDGTYKTRPITAKEVKSLKGDKEGKTPEQILQRISQIKDRIARIQQMGAVDPLDMMFLEKVGAKIQPADTQGAVDAYENELRVLEGQLPENYRMAKKPSAPPQEVEDNAQNFIDKHTKVKFK